MKFHDDISILHTYIHAHVHIQADHFFTTLSKRDCGHTFISNRDFVEYRI